MRDNHSPLDDLRCRLTISNFGRHWFRKTTIVLVCVALIVAIVGPAQAMVVCVGANGHVDVELALGGCYSTSQGPAGPQQLDFDTTHFGCAGCVDFQLASPALQTNAHRLKYTGRGFNAAPASGASADSGTRIPNLRDLAVLLPPLSLDLLATVVLLT